MVAGILTRQMGGNVDLRPPVPGRCSPDAAMLPAESSCKPLIYINYFFANVIPVQLPKVLRGNPQENKGEVGLPWPGVLCGPPSFAFFRKFA